MLEHTLYDSFIKTHANPFWRKLSQKILNDFKIVAIVGKRKFESEPHNLLWNKRLF